MGNTVQAYTTKIIFFIQNMLDNFSWCTSSYAQKQKKITQSIEAISDTFYDRYRDETIVSLGKKLLEQRSRVTCPTQEDIAWVQDIIQVFINSTCTTVLEVENYYAISSFLHPPFATDTLYTPQHMAQQCLLYNTDYAEALLIPAHELEMLLTRSVLFFHERTREQILTAVCGVIRFSARMAELGNFDTAWEKTVRQELCQMHSLSIHLCIALDDAEIHTFITEAESNTPSAIVNTIIQQLTLEEIYRKYGEESMIFSKISILLPYIPPAIYYGTSSPIFSLSSVLESYITSYNALFSMPLEQFIDIITSTPSIHSAQNFSSLTKAIIFSNNIATILRVSAHDERYSIEKLEKIYTYYTNTSLEILEQHVHIAENLIPTPQAVPSIPLQILFDSFLSFPYEEGTCICRYIHTILDEKNEEYNQPTMANYHSILQQFHTIPKQYHNAIALLTQKLYSTGISYSNQEYVECIHSLYSTSKEFLGIAPSIFSAIIEETIYESTTLEHITALYQHYSLYIQAMKTTINSSSAIEAVPYNTIEVVETISIENELITSDIELEEIASYEHTQEQALEEIAIKNGYRAQKNAFGISTSRMIH